MVFLFDQNSFKKKKKKEFLDKIVAGQKVNCGFISNEIY